MKFDKKTVTLVLSVLLNVLGVLGVIPPAVPQPRSFAEIPEQCQGPADAGVE